MSSLFAWSKAICLVLIATETFAAPLEKRAPCSAYTLLETRGTNEPQGPSNSFKTMDANILAQVTGGSEYDTIYPAGIDQNSASGTTDIVNYITNGLEADPNRCFILEGYSQGASATVDAMRKLTGASFDAVKGVFLVGNPQRKSGLACNVDEKGGTTTKKVNGLEFFKGGIPANWVSKTLDVCIYGDTVCDISHGLADLAKHLTYKSNPDVQNQGTEFVIGKLQAST